MKNINHSLLCIALSAALATTAALAQTPYDEGQKALRDARWLEAADWFEQAQESGDEVDAALYWRAHALYRAGRHADAARELRELESRYPDSRWVSEGKALRMEYQGGSGKPVVDDELRLFALSQLMERDPERALPLVMDTLRDTDSDKVRQQALFLLGMSELPQANQAVAEFARDSNNPELQVQAIHMLGAAGSEQALALLGDLYRDATDKRVKRAVVHAYIAADDPEPLVAMLRDEQDPGLQREMLHALGAMDATDRLDAIYNELDSKEARRAAIEAFSIAGDSERLRQAVTSESDPDLVRAAITGIAVAGDADAEDTLAQVYRDAPEASTRRAVVEAMIILDEGEDLLLEIVRTDSDPEVRQQAIQALGVNGATERLHELYGGIDDRETRRVALQAMMIADDAEGLERIVRTEQDPELRSEAIRTLGMTGSDSARDTLTSLYPSASHAEKRAVVEAMMMNDDVSGLVGLLDSEQDPELKRYILQTLSHIDSEEADEVLFRMLEEEP